MQYLPEYYQHSREMNRIQQIAGEEIIDFTGDKSINMDIDGEWTNLYIWGAKGEFLDLWLEEFDEKSKDDLIAKIRSGGYLNKEVIEKNGFRVIESFIYSPEDGYDLSEDFSVFPDGDEYAPMISWILFPPEDHLVAKRLVQLTGLAGFKYILCPNLINPVTFNGIIPFQSTTLNRKIYTMMKRQKAYFESLHREFQMHADLGEKPWFNPLLGFTSDMDFISKEKYRSAFSSNTGVKGLEAQIKIKDVITKQSLARALFGQAKSNVNSSYTLNGRQFSMHAVRGRPNFSHIASFLDDGNFIGGRVRDAASSNSKGFIMNVIVNPVIPTLSRASVFTASPVKNNILSNSGTSKQFSMYAVRKRSSFNTLTSFLDKGSFIGGETRDAGSATSKGYTETAVNKKQVITKNRTSYYIHDVKNAQPVSNGDKTRTQSMSVDARKEFWFSPHYSFLSPMSFISDGTTAQLSNITKVKG